ncbi:hypothetical protein [Pseudoalteromonas sp. MTN2-4]|uniref:hypothetical protein n=1 Tax=Pseudoalteromonas sp. MTN2-4 TaxID=3056555 RepID=UPI0036F274D3
MGDYSKAVIYLFFCVAMFNAYAEIKTTETKAVYSLLLQDLLNIKIVTSTLTKKAIADIPSPVAVFTRDTRVCAGLSSYTL